MEVPGGFPMANSAKGPKREIVLTPEMEASFCRSRLMALYESDQRFQWIVDQDLGQRWQALSDAAKAKLVFGSFTAKHNFVAQTESDLNAYSEYRLQLNSTIQDILGLCDVETGEAPTWVVDGIHRLVSKKDMERIRASKRTVLIGGRTYEPIPGLNIELNFGPTYVNIRFPTEFDEEHGPWEPEDGLDLSPRDLIGFGEEHWANLESKINEWVKIGIERLRSEVESTFPQRRRPTGLKRRSQDLEKLKAWAFHQDRPLLRSERDRIRKICALLRIKVPPSRSSAI